MIRLYVFEWKKLFNKKSFILSFLILFLLNCCLLSYSKYSQLQNNQGLEKAYTYYAKQIVGTLNDAGNTISQFNKDLEHKSEKPISGGIDGDQMMLRQLADEVQSLLTYEKEMQIFIEKTEQNIQYFNDRNEQDKVGINKRLKESYEHRRITNFSYLKGWNQLLKYQASSLLILLLLFIVIPPIWSSEREAEMDMLMKSTKEGNKRILKVKFLFTISFVLAISVLFAVSELFLMYMLYGLDGMSTPIYAIAEYRMSTWNITCIGLWIYLFLLKLLAFSTIALLTLFLSKQFKNVILASLLIGGLFLILVSIQEYKIVIWNPISLLSTYKNFSNTSILMLGNFPFFPYELNALFCTLLAIVTSLFYFNNGRRRWICKVK